MGAYNVTMTCCSSEEIAADDNQPIVPTVDRYPDTEQYTFPRSDSELTKTALED